MSIVNDMLVESDERFFADLTLVSSDATGVTVAPDMAVVTITDEDRESTPATMYTHSYYPFSLTLIKEQPLALLPIATMCRSRMDS